MNENPGGTPNPLNPNVGPVPTPEPLSANPAEPVAAPVASPAVSPTPNPAPQTSPETAPTLETEAPVNPIVAAAEQETPTEEPKGSVVEKPKKKKTGLIIGIIVLLIALIGGGVAAAFMLGLFNGGDPVAAAVAKMTGSERPENVSVNGSITILPEDTTAGVSKVVIDLKTSAQTSTMINSTTATLTATTTAGEVEVSLGEVYAANGDLYFNVSGISEAINLLSNPLPTEEIDYELLDDEDMLDADALDAESDELATNCAATDGIETDCLEPVEVSPLAGIVAGIFSAVDGEWIRISTDSLEDLSSDFAIDESAQCLIEAANDASKNGNSIVEIYNKNAFISGTSENVSVAKKNDPIYKVVFDTEKMTSFFDAVDSANIYGDSSCFGTSGEISSKDIVEKIKSLPTIYVEVNSDSQFTRLYMSGSSDGGTIVADLSLAYPTNINVSEPEEYIEFEDVLTGIFMSMFDYSDYDDVDIDFSEEL